MQQSAQLRISVAQINTSVNNIRRNVDAIACSWKTAREQGADLVVTPELSITGYPLEDSVENPDLLAAAQQGLQELIGLSAKGGPGMLVGLPQKIDGKIYNTAALVHEGKILGMVSKTHLPNYDVFDEKRNFTGGTFSGPLTFKGRKLGVLICEDVWFPDVAQKLKDAGAKVLIAMNASPFETGKLDRRLNDVIHKRVEETGLPILYVNQVGGQDQVVFDGYSTALNADGDIAYLGKGFEEAQDILTLNFTKGKPAFFTDRCLAMQPEDRLESVWKALVTGTRDYLHKTGFQKALLGMSGGIDSAVVAAIAVDALGPENVTLYRLPSQYTEDISNNEATNAAKLLGARIEGIPIAPVFQTFQDGLRSHFDEALQQGKTRNVDTALENLQARIRGTILMGLSNASGAMLLSTGNKSEVSVGYCTLYGDMNGGFNPLKDVYKTMVFKLADWRNKNYPRGMLGPQGLVVPQAIIDRPPSAELAPGQRDDATLPPYDILDPILEGYIEGQKSIVDIAAGTGQPQDLVERMVRLVDINEFKRRQSAPGIKITSKSLGTGRRYPIAQPPLPTVLTGMGMNP